MQHHREAIKAISKDVDLTDAQKEMWLEFREDVRQSMQDKKNVIKKENKKDTTFIKIYMPLS